MGEEGDTENREEGRSRDGKDPDDVSDKHHPARACPRRGIVLREWLSEWLSAAAVLRHVLPGTPITSARRWRRRDASARRITRPPNQQRPPLRGFQRDIFGRGVKPSAEARKAAG